ncbi:MAG: hypothetical protein HDR82_09505 [Bacteroides sp.]|nr:hypothetical protein [Bacteroides sp.]
MKWQYKTVIAANCYELNRELNRLGKKGWEAYGSATIQHADHSSTHIAYLKRPKVKQ